MKIFIRGCLFEEEILMEQSHVIRAFYDSILDLTSRLEAVEGDEDAKPKVQIESREAYMKILEEEDPDRWIELLGEEEGAPSASTSSLYSQTDVDMRIIVSYSWQ